MRQKTKPVKTDGLVKTSQGNSFTLFPEETCLHVPLFIFLFVPLSAATLLLLISFSQCAENIVQNTFMHLVQRESKIVGSEQWVRGYRLYSTMIRPQRVISVKDNVTIPKRGKALVSIYASEGFKLLSFEHRFTGAYFSCFFWNYFLIYPLILFRKAHN